VSATYQIRLERPDGVHEFTASADEYLLYALIDAGIESPFICEQGWCLACAAWVERGEVDRADALTLYPEDAASGFVLLCSAKPRSDLILRQDVRQTRRDMTQQRVTLGQLARAYPPAARAGFRRGRAKPLPP